MKTKVTSEKPAKSESQNKLTVLDSPNENLAKDAKSAIEAINNATKKRNKEFSKMSRMEKRVEIAKDVKKSLEAGKYIAESGTYLGMSKKGSDRYDNDYGSFKISIENLLDKNVQCEVCAIGSMFVSHVKKSNTSKLTESDNKMVSSMKDIFTKHELRLLESVFEGRDVNATFNYKFDKMLEDAEIFYKTHRSDESRLNAIMDNIIKNEGKFIYKSIEI